MDLALIGTGKTGSAIDRLAASYGHKVVSRFNSRQPLLDAAPSDLKGAKLAIDFSRPDLAIPHIERYCTWGIDAVIGTTGWDDQREHVEALVDKSHIGLLYAANFSIGVALTTRLAETAAQLVDALPEYDISVHEVHHRYKLDSPSGTALLLANLILNQIQRKTKLEPETQHRPIDPEALHVTSTRMGYVFGKHDISIDGPYDTITLSHEAKSRDGFASGALQAASWLKGKRGLFSLDDFIDDWLGK